MDFAAAVAQHLAWKQSLRRILLGRERRRKPERTEAIGCHHCPLDEWIKSATAIYGQLPLFDYVDEQHQLSHDLAIQMVRSEDPARTEFCNLLKVTQ